MGKVGDVPAWRTKVNRVGDITGNTRVLDSIAGGQNPIKYL